MKTVDDMSVGELAAYVSTHLRSRGIDTVLSGESCAWIHGARAVVSTYLDFVDRRSSKARDIRAAMGEIGFVPEGDKFKHPLSDMLVGFPKGPSSIGGGRITKVLDVEFSTGMLRILSPTDCVKDRLAGYVHGQDLESFEQAVLLATKKKIDLEEIRRWAEQEGKLEALAEFFERSNG